MTGISVTHMVPADTELEAAALAFLRLPPDHRAAAVLADCWAEPWLPGWWNARFDLPTFDVADALVPDRWDAG